MKPKPLFLMALILGLFVVLGSLVATHLEGKADSQNAKPLKASPVFFLPEGFRDFVTSWLALKADEDFHDGKWSQIAHLLRARARLDPRLTDSWSTGAWHLAFNLSEREKDPLEKKKRIFEGIEFLEEGIRTSPGTAHLYFDLGWIYEMRLGDSDKALELFQKAFDLEPSSKAAIWIAHLYRKLSRFDEEMRLWEKYIAHFPSDKRALNRFGKAYVRARKTESIHPEPVAAERKTILSKG